MPKEAEKQKILEDLAQEKDKRTAIRDLFWAVLNTDEFCSTTRTRSIMTGTIFVLGNALRGVPGAAKISSRGMERHGGRSLNSGLAVR